MHSAEAVTSAMLRAAESAPRRCSIFVYASQPGDRASTPKQGAYKASVSKVVKVA